MPPDAVSWDDASNNRALISGKAALIWNPPSAWAVAKRDAPDVAADCWTFPNPLGPKGRLVPHRPYFWGVWSFSQNQSAAKEIIEYLSQREQVESLAAAVAGYDIPPFESMYRPEDLERGRAAEGHDLQLPGAAVAPCGILHPRLVGAAGDRGADLEPQHPARHGRAADVRPDDQAVDRLGEGRAGRLRSLSATYGPASRACAAVRRRCTPRSAVLTILSSRR